MDVKSARSLSADDEIATRRRFEFCMSKAARPDVSASTERLQVTAQYARVRLAFGAPLLAALSGVKSTAFRVRLRLI